MKRVSGEYIKIRGPHHYDAALLMYGEDSVENARKTIDMSNKRRIEDGWISEPERYQILCVEWYRWENEDGTFIKAEEYTNVIETYPA